MKNWFKNLYHDSTTIHHIELKATRAHLKLNTDLEDVVAKDFGKDFAYNAIELLGDMDRISNKQKMKWFWQDYTTAILISLFFAVLISAFISITLRINGIIIGITNFIIILFIATLIVNKKQKNVIKGYNLLMKKVNKEIDELNN